MADGGHFEKSINCHTLTTVRPIPNKTAFMTCRQCLCLLEFAGKMIFAVLKWWHLQHFKSLWCTFGKVIETFLSLCASERATDLLQKLQIGAENATGCQYCSSGVLIYDLSRRLTEHGGRWPHTLLAVWAICRLHAPSRGLGRPILFWSEFTDAEDPFTSPKQNWTELNWTYAKVSK